MSENELFAFVIAVAVLGGYWFIKGAIRLFQRHNAIVMILYASLLFPVFAFHAGCVGMFGKSQKEYDNQVVEQHAKLMREAVKFNEESK